MENLILVTGGAGVAGSETARQLSKAGFRLRIADTVMPAAMPTNAEFMRVDLRTPGDCTRAVQGVDGVIHLAGWHCGHVPSVSDDTMWAVNVDGTFNLTQACLKQPIKSFVFGSSMAYGHGSVYSLTKVVGEEICRGYHTQSGTPLAMLRYHDFVPKYYLDFGEKLLRNGVDVQDVASANCAAVTSGFDNRYTIFQSVVHTDHAIPELVLQRFSTYWPVWCEQVVPGSTELIDAYGIDVPSNVERHDLSKIGSLTGWKPKIGFKEFLEDLNIRHRHGENIRNLWSRGGLLLC